MSDALSRSPIFIVGTGRSGTSLLRAMLNAHSRVFIAQETAVYNWLDRGRLPGCRTAEAWLEGYARSASFRLQDLDPAAVRARLPAGALRQDRAAIVSAVLQAAAARYGRPRWGDKTPLHALKLDAIFQDFPDARVIAVFRHPVPTAASVARMPWGSDSALLNAGGMARVYAAVRRWPGVLVLRLEDLIAAPRATLAAALDHLGEPWEEAVLDHAARQPDAGGPRLPWFSSASRPVAAERAATELGLSPAALRLVERKTRALMAGLDYAPCAVAAEPSRAALLRAWLEDAGRAARYLLRAARTAPPLRDPRRIDATEQLRWLFGLNPSPAVPAAHRALPELPPISAPDRSGPPAR